MDCPLSKLLRPSVDQDLEKALTDKHILINSGPFNRLDFASGFDAITRALNEKGWGRQVNYRLRDWGVSRQRYWGCHSMIHCGACGAVPVPEDDLPVELPTEVVFEGVGSPLKKMRDWAKVACPSCGGDAERKLTPSIPLWNRVGTTRASCRAMRTPCSMKRPAIGAASITM